MRFINRRMERARWTQKMARLMIIFKLLLTVPFGVAQSTSSSVNTSVEMESAAVTNYLTGSSLAWMLNIYNPHRWNPLSPPGELSPSCLTDMTTFLMGLDNNTLWAAKMLDASGRYSSQFFFGNDFWLGSLTLCKELEDPTDENPPFSVNFHVANLQVSLPENLSTKPRLILLGLCLPRSCGIRDITSLLENNENQKGTQGKLSILKVRPVPGGYSFFSDIKVHILGGVLAVILLLMAAGSCYELVVESREYQKNLKKDDGPRQNGVVNKGFDQEEGDDRCKQHTTQSRPERKQNLSQGLFSRLLLSFSIVSNGRKILNCDTAEDALTSVHGLRFLSLAWVILVHTYLQVFAIAGNKRLRTLTERNFLFQTISNATFSVDTFFFISGLLVTYLFLRSSKRALEEGKKQLGLPATGAKFASLLFYRFIRLTPAYLFVLGLVEVAMRYVRDNTVFEPLFIDHITCRDFWWRNALYINSLFPRKDMCMLWSWYMANDTQFYVVGTLLLLFSAKYFKLVSIVWGILMLSTWGTTGFISVHYKYYARIQEPFALFDELYDKPWTRLGPYLVGMATGLLLHRSKNKISMSPLTVLCGWSMSLLVLTSLVYGLLHVELGLFASAAYVALGHTAWGLALAWIVVACCTGHGGIVNSFLSFKALYPLSRLTYCAYLVHPLIMFFTSLQMDGPFHLHNALVIVLYMGNVVASFLLSFFISLAFEAPVVGLLKILMSAGKKNS